MNGQEPRHTRSLLTTETQVAMCIEPPRITRRSIIRQVRPTRGSVWDDHSRSPGNRPGTDSINAWDAKRFRHSRPVGALDAIDVPLLGEEEPPVAGVLHLARPAADEGVEEARCAVVVRP